METLNIALSIQDSLADEIREYWKDDDSIDDKNSLLNRAACNAYTQFCTTQSKQTPKTTYIDQQTLSQIDQRKDAWDKTENAALLLPHGWQQVALREHKKATTTGTKLSTIQLQAIFTEIPLAYLEHFCTTWVTWKLLHNQTRNDIRNRKLLHLETIITETGEPHTETNIWKAIDRIAPAPRKIRSSNLGVEKATGGWCYSPDEVIEEIQNFALDELWQKNQLLSILRPPLNPFASPQCSGTLLPHQSLTLSPPSARLIPIAPLPRGPRP